MLIGNDSDDTNSICSAVFYTVMMMMMSSMNPVDSQLAGLPRTQWTLTAGFCEWCCVLCPSGYFTGQSNDEVVLPAQRHSLRDMAPHIVIIFHIRGLLCLRLCIVLTLVFTLNLFFPTLDIVYADERLLRYHWFFLLGCIFILFPFRSGCSLYLKMRGGGGGGGGGGIGVALQECFSI